MDLWFLTWIGPSVFSFYPLLKLLLCYGWGWSSFPLRIGLALLPSPIFQTGPPNTSLFPEQSLSLEFISEHCTELSVREVFQICGPPGKKTEEISPMFEPCELHHRYKDRTISFSIHVPQYAVSCEYFLVSWFTANAGITEKEVVRQAKSFPIWSLIKSCCSLAFRCQKAN